MTEFDLETVALTYKDNFTSLYGRVEERCQEIFGTGVVAGYLARAISCIVIDIAFEILLRTEKEIKEKKVEKIKK